MRNPDFQAFQRFNFIEFGAQIRHLQDQIPVVAQDSPKPGTEFGAETFGYHLCLLEFLSVWLEALGFRLGGKSSFDAAHKAFTKFCQQGAHHQGPAMEGHVANMRVLYRSLLHDMHVGFHCFWNRRLLTYDQLMSVDTLFPTSGLFFGNLRQMKLDIANYNSVSRGGPPPPTMAQPLAGSNRKRSKAQEGGQGASSSTSATLSRSSPSAPRAPPQLGELAWGVHEDSEYIKIFDFKFAKAPILEKLQLKETDLCLASYLSRKGVAVCPHAGKPGHEGPQSSLHVFTAAANSLRPSFDHSPYRVAKDADQGKGSKSKRGKQKESGAPRPGGMEVDQ